MKSIGESDRCPRLEEFVDEFALMKPISAEFSGHAKECGYCLFGLTHSLAIVEACSLLAREKLSNCPKRDVFRDLLFVSVRSQKRIKELNGGAEPPPDARKNILEVVAGEIDRFVPLFQHLNDCNLCHKYYDELYAYETRTRDRYEKELLAGKELIPIMLEEDSGLGFDAH